MSDRTTPCDEVCLHIDEYLITPIICCIGDHQIEPKTVISDAYPEIAFELPSGYYGKGTKGRIRTRIMDIIALIRDILLPVSQGGADSEPNGNGASPAVIFKSYGGTVQPMMWSPENQGGKRDR